MPSLTVTACLHNISDTLVTRIPTRQSETHSPTGRFRDPLGRLWDASKIARNPLQTLPWDGWYGCTASKTPARGEFFPNSQLFRDGLFACLKHSNRLHFTEGR